MARFGDCEKKRRKRIMLSFSINCVIYSSIKREKREICSYVK